MQRVVRVFGQPLHAILSDFPVALFYSSLVTDFAGLVRNEVLWWHMSFWMLIGGVGSALIASVIGIIDATAGETRERATDTLMWHLILMLLTIGSAVGSIFFRLDVIQPHGARLYLALAFSLFTAITLSVGGWFGGELVYRHGIGRRGPKGVA